MSDSRVETGLIIKGIGGFYYVEAAGTVYECRAKGILRRQGVTPLAGDRCTIALKEGDMPLVSAIEPRKNSLVRPPVANLDKLFIVISACQPMPNPLITDRLIAAAEQVGIEPVVVLTKLDLSEIETLGRIYECAGFKVIRVDYRDGSGVDRLKSEMSGCLSAFAGNSGVGKSTLLNAIEPDIMQKTAQISAKLGRGRHTTRSVELFKLSCGGTIADTPGFSSFESELVTPIDKEELAGCFREFEPYLGRCKFASCAHLCEKGCAVVEAVANGEIASSRHESYRVMYEEAKNIKPWETRD